MMKTTMRCLALMAMVLIMAVGCSKSSNGDAESLLRTVPADAASVVTVDVARTLKSLGCSTDGNTIKLSKELKNAIDSSTSIKSEDKKAFADICDGNTGVALSSVVYFSAARSYLTGLLNDPDKFIDYISALDSVPRPVKEENGARIVGNAAVIGNQFWICSTGTPDSEQLKYYQQLGEKQSYIGTEAADLLLKNESAVAYVADVNRLMGAIPEAATLRMSASLMFKDMAYVAGDADFKGRNLLTSARVLNSKMEPAELLLPTEKIDASVVKSFSGDADLYLAAGLSKKLTEKLAQMAGTAMGAMASQFTGPLSAIDGTLAVRADGAMNQFDAKLETSGKDFAELSNIISNLFHMEVTRDGDVLTAKTSDRPMTGNIAPAAAADKMKGAWIGAVAYNVPAKEMTTVARLLPEKKSLTLSVEVEGGMEAIMTALMK